MTILVLLTAALSGSSKTAAAGEVAIYVVQIGATRGAGEQQFDARLQRLKSKLARLPYRKFEWIGKFSGSTVYKGTVTIALAEGLTLRATPRRDGKRIGLAAELLKDGKHVMRTTLRVRPGRVGFLIHSAGKRHTILAVTAQ